MDLKELFESNDMQVFVETNQELINETAQSVDNFADYLVEYVADNPNIFIEPNLQTMYKNIRTFSEVAMQQYLHEITAINAEYAVVVEPITPENALDDYL